jgi:pyruvate ferredoxin oxidoreductase gamma subunit
MAGEVLAEAFFAAGKWVQAFSSYGGARRGTPVLTAIRVDDKPVRLRSNIEHPDAIVCFDPSLLGPALLEGAGPDTVVLVNSSKAPEEFREYGDFKWATIDGISIAANNKLGRIVNSAVLGAFARIMGVPDMESLAETVEEVSPVKKPQNAQAARDGYEQVKTAREQAA